MKTVKQFLEGLPEPIRSQALNNADPYFYTLEVDGPTDALSKAFIWLNTPEGPGYWEGVARTLEALTGAPAPTEAPKSEYVVQAHLYKVKESTQTIGQISSSTDVERIARRCYAD